MLHLFHLGPLPFDERLLWLLSAVDPQGAFSHQVLERDLSAGLTAVAAKHGAENLRVEPALAELAAPLGIASAPLPAQALKPRAVLAFAFANGHALCRTTSVIAAFLEACARFGDVAPWMQFTSREAFRVRIRESWREWCHVLVGMSRSEASGLS